MTDPPPHSPSPGVPGEGRGEGQRGSKPTAPPPGHSRTSDSLHASLVTRQPDSLHVSRFTFQAPSPTPPLFTWLALQLTALLLSAERIPFSPRLPGPFELYAAHVMAIVQLTAATLLLPFLFRTRESSLGIILTAPPLLFFAGYLADVPLSSTAWASAYVVMYLGAIAVAIRAPLDPRLLQLVLTTILFAGPVLLYLGAEFGSPSEVVTRTLRCTPAVAALRIIDGKTEGFSFLIGPVLAAVWHALGRLFPTPRA